MKEAEAVPDKRHHRGPDPEDERLFATDAVPVLRSATSDLCWLLNRDYPATSALELVGNRYALTRRQRMAVGRCACADQDLRRRKEHEVQPSQLKAQELWLDGYNVLTGIEAALAGGVILLGCDGCCRDLAGVHGRFRKLEETVPALRLVGALTAEWGVRRCRWWLDRPVSNSGRLQQLIADLAAKAGWDWQVETVFNPDKVLAATEQIVATSDSAVLDRCRRWLNLTRLVIDRSVAHAHVVDLCVAAVDKSTGTADAPEGRWRIGDDAG
jgi:hypothetical protein